MPSINTFLPHKLSIVLKGYYVDMGYALGEESVIKDDAINTLKSSSK